MKSRPCLVPWGVACGSCSLDSPEGRARQDQNLILTPAVLEPGALGAGIVLWDLPVLLASPHHDFGQSLRGLSFLGPCDSSRAELHGPRAQTGTSLSPRLPLGSRSPPRAGPKLGEVLGSACLKLLTLLGVSLVARAGTVTGCTWMSRAGPQATTQGHSPLW